MRRVPLPEFLLAVQLFGASVLAQSSRPNILVFIADDAGSDFGCHGNKGIKTPRIDRLAAEGLQFTNAFLTTSQCSPSRISILSGKFAHTVGCEDLHVDLDSTTKILPHYLQQVGYFTGVMLKTHFGKHGLDQFNWYDHGYVEYFKGQWDQVYLRNFRQFLKVAEGKPFFLWVGLMDPHKPYDDPLTSAPKVHSADDVTVPPFLVDSVTTRTELARYYDTLHRMDAHIGRMLEMLETTGQARNTVVIFMSDNGMPFPRAKATVYDAGIRTPLIIRWPGRIEPGSTYLGQVSVIDLAPTLLDLAGVAVPKDWYGQSIQTVLYDQKKPGRQYVFSERNWHDTSARVRSVRSETHKLIINYYTDGRYPLTGDYNRSGAWNDLQERHKASRLTPDQKAIFARPWPMVECYDLRNDPFETRNLCAEKPAAGIPVDLLEQLLKWERQTKDFVPQIANPNARKKEPSQWAEHIRSVKGKQGTSAEASSAQSR